MRAFLSTLQQLKQRGSFHIAATPSTCAAQDGARSDFGIYGFPKPPQLPPLGRVLTTQGDARRFLGDPATTASGRYIVGGEVNRDRADAAVTQPRQSRLRNAGPNRCSYRIWAFCFPQGKLPQFRSPSVQPKAELVLFVAAGPNMPTAPLLDCISRKGNVRSCDLGGRRPSIPGRCAVSPRNRPGEWTAVSVPPGTLREGQGRRTRLSSPRSPQVCRQAPARSLR